MKRLFSLLLATCFITFLQAQDTAKIVKTTGHVSINNKTVNYEATTGFLPLKNKDGKAIANIFYVAYIKSDVSDVRTRPITFVFNGGPGSSSAWLHMGAIGPKKVVTTEYGKAEIPPKTYNLVNNDQCWLDITDLVFIDPVGCGFSKPIEEEKAEQFYGYENDIHTIGDFINQWTGKNKRWGSPKFLAGESYGTTRACGVADYMTDIYNMYFNGISLISCALDFETLREYNTNQILPYICNLPVYAELAIYHEVITPEKSTNEFIEDVEDFALNEYAVALLKGDLLSVSEKYAMAKKMESLIGINADIIFDHDLRIPSGQFRKFLLDKQNLIIGRYDGRLTMPDPMNNRDYAYEDPSFTEIAGAVSAAFNDYVRNELNYPIDDRFYLIGDVRPWKYGDGKYLNVTPELGYSLSVNPNMEILVANGRYDLATSYFGTSYAINHMNLPSVLRNRITFTYYNGGHMMYLVPSELKKLKEDVTKMYNRSLGL
ncbi:MAG: hypothetical protein MJ198_05620 [Bacteroidales bacterium]|nr:hypothetical protein [Bacteroidales bacterium]